MEHITNFLVNANAFIVAVCQFLAIVVISIGIIKALKIYLADVLTPGRSTAAVRQSRLELGHSFSLALGFLIGASILKTTLAPTWSDIGQLAAIIAIRTILNYFLLHDIAVETESVAKSPHFFANLFHHSGKSAPQTSATQNKTPDDEKQVAAK